MTDSIPDLIAEAEHAVDYYDVKKISPLLVERLIRALKSSGLYYLRMGWHEGFTEHVRNPNTTTVNDNPYLEFTND